jgi:hypothetical protein
LRRVPISNTNMRQSAPRIEISGHQISVSGR